MHIRPLQSKLLALVALLALNACAPKASISARKEGADVGNGVSDSSKDASKDSLKPTPKTKNPPKKDNGSKDPIEDDSIGPSDQNTDSDSTESCYKGSEFICKVEALITKKTNAYRVGRGLQAVENDSKVAFVSRDWSQKQASRGMISHSGFPSARAALFAQEFNVRTNLRGENVAMFSGMGSGAETDEEAERVAQRFAVMWWNSAGHRANMLGRGHTSLGNGVYKTRNGYYATQIFK